MGKILNRLSISQPRRTIETMTTRMAMVSPKFKRLREGSKRLATKPRILRVAKPNTRTHKMLYMSLFLSRSSNKVAKETGIASRTPATRRDMGRRRSRAVRDKGMGAVSGRQTEDATQCLSKRDDITLFRARSHSRRQQLFATRREMEDQREGREEQARKGLRSRRFAPACLESAVHPQPWGRMSPEMKPETTSFVVLLGVLWLRRQVFMPRQRSRRSNRMPQPDPASKARAHGRPFTKSAAAQGRGPGTAGQRSARPLGRGSIYAQNQHDLFFAQGFVAAQDRLFQMELWKRSGQGRLAEVLGPSALPRDINARLLSYRGDMKAEYESYSPDTQAILEAFTAGINAYIASRMAPGGTGFHWSFKLPVSSPSHGSRPTA